MCSDVWLLRMNDGKCAVLFTLPIISFVFNRGKDNDNLSPLFRN